MLMNRMTPQLIAASLFTISLATPLQAQESKEISAEEAQRIEEIKFQINKLTTEMQQIERAAQAAEATTPQPEPAPEPEPEEIKIWSGDIEFGYADTSGNTEETTVSSSISLQRERDAWRYNIDADSLNSSSDGERTGENYFISNRLAYQYNEHDYSFLYGSYDDDRFSGFDYQATVAVGYGRRLLNNEMMKWDVEIGPGYRVNKVSDETMDSEDTEEVIIRAFSKYLWKFSETASFSQSINVESGDDNTISTAETALKMAVIGEISVKLSYNIKYTEEVPEGNRHADKETIVSLSYAF